MPDSEGKLHLTDTPQGNGKTHTSSVSHSTTPLKRIDRWYTSIVLN